MAKDQGNKKPEVKKEKKPFFLKRAWDYIVSCFKELKNVSWPTKADLLKMTGAVIIFLVLMTVILGIMDVIGSLLLDWLVA